MYYVVIDELDIYGTFSKGGLEVGDIIYKVTIGDKSFDASNYDRDTLTNLANFLDNKSYKIGDEVKVSYGRYNSSSRSYETAEKTFKIEQYRYGVI